MRGSQLQMGIDFVSRLLKVSNVTVHKWVAEGKMKSLEPEDIHDFMAEQFDKIYKKKYAKMLLENQSYSLAPAPDGTSLKLVNDTSPSTSPKLVPPTSPITSHEIPAPKEEVLVSPPSWATNVQVPYSPEDLEEDGVASSRDPRAGLFAQFHKD